MNKSMTGYGREERILNDRKIAIEIRSVNHRYLDINIKTPRAYSFLEEMIRREIPAIAGRGKIEVFVSLENYQKGDKKVLMDLALAQQYYNAGQTIAAEFSIENNLKASNLMYFNDVITLEKCEEDKEALWSDVKQVFDAAGAQFVAMREGEGKRMEQILLDRAEVIAEVVAKIKQLLPGSVDKYKERLLGRIEEMLGQIEIDQSRILTEVAIFADKVNVDEELDRLCSHLVEYKNILHSDEAGGRKLDFLLQEMNREINTIGSKSNEIEISKLVVQTKAELEKIREQIQNIE